MTSPVLIVDDSLTVRMDLGEAFEEAGFVPRCNAATNELIRCVDGLEIAFDCGAALCSEEDGGTVPKRLEGHRKLLRDFERGLARVRRVLANIPTYMVFDDHDVTDDWNLNPLWLDRVLTTPLGVTVVRNALITYALFQDWGNDPLKYENTLDDKHKLLDHIAALFPPGAQEGPDVAAQGGRQRLVDGSADHRLVSPREADGERRTKEDRRQAASSPEPTAGGDECA